MTSATYLLSAILSMMAKLSASSLVSFRLKFVIVLIIVFISSLAILLVKDSLRVFGRHLMYRLIQCLPRMLRPLVNLLLTVAMLILILALLNIIFIVLVFSMFFIFG